MVHEKQADRAEPDVMVEDDEELKELRLLEQKRILYDWKKNNRDYKERLAAIQMKYKPAQCARSSRKFANKWGEEAGLFEHVLEDCDDFVEGKQQLENVTKGENGQWQNDRVSRGNLEWRRFEFIQDMEVTRWGRLIKMQDGSMRIQEGKKILDTGEVVKEEVRSSSMFTLVRITCLTCILFLQPKEERVVEAEPKAAASPAASVRSTRSRADDAKPSEPIVAAKKSRAKR